MLGNIADDALATIVRACRGGHILSADWLRGLGLPEQTIRALYNVHVPGYRNDHGIEVGRDYRGTILTLDARAQKHDGVFDMELLTVIAGDLGLPVLFPHQSLSENAEELRRIIEHALELRRARRGEPAPAAPPPKRRARNRKN